MVNFISADVGFVGLVLELVINDNVDFWEKVFKFSVFSKVFYL